MEQIDWGPRLVRLIAGEIRRLRKERGFSAQGLADRCAELGWPIKRSVLSNLESGYRETITVPELLVLARALGVPPLRLLLPLGHSDTVEILPNVDMVTTDALLWLRGGGPDDSDRTVGYFVGHHKAVGRWSEARWRAREIRRGNLAGNDDDADDYERRAEREANALRGLRDMLRSRGMSPPELPAGLAYIDGERP